MSVTYQIKAHNLQAHLFRVRCTISQPNPDGQSVQMPTWIPGSYLIREYAQHISHFSVQDLDGNAVKFEKTDKCTWRCEPCENTICISYEVYAWDLSVRGAHLDQLHGYFNGACVFMQVLGQTQQACELHILPPDGKAYKNWQVGTSLAEKTAVRYGFGCYQANDYDDLIDHPVEMGHFSLDHFDVAGIQHDLIISGKHWGDRHRMVMDLQKICQGQQKLFGELPPMSRYVFLLSVLNKNDGGLEHRHSCSLFCDRSLLPKAKDKGISTAYLQFLGLCSHEYLHAWHIKRIKPAAFMPYQLQQESYTRQLWIFEGITSYYDDLNLLRSGLISLNSYLELMGKTITQVYRGQGRYQQSVSESSFDAWIKAYRPNENSPNTNVSYYSKGALIAFALDLRLRRDSHITLDNIMRQLWLKYGKPLIGLVEGKLEQLIQTQSGLDLNDFFQRYVYGCEDLPLAELLEYIGIESQLRAPLFSQDTGGIHWLNKSDSQLTVNLGIKLSASNPPQITHVENNSAAEIAGLAGKDELIALAGLKVNAQNIDELLAQFKIGDTIDIFFFRNAELQQRQLTFKPAPLNTCVLRCQADISAKTQQHQQAWCKHPNI